MVASARTIHPRSRRPFTARTLPDTVSLTLDRRRFLELTAASAGALLLQSCLKNSSTGVPESSVPEVFYDLSRQLARGGKPGLLVFAGASEFLAEQNQRLPLRLDHPKTGTIQGAAGTIYLGQNGEKEGPFDLTWQTFRNPDGRVRGFYESILPMPGPGVVDLCVSMESNIFGFAVIEATDDPSVPAPREKAISVPTPVTGNLMDSAYLCTREPPCSMHAVSLDQALAAGKPTILIIGSPRFCTSGVCGPVVDEVLAARSMIGDAATFIHVEPFKGDSPTELSATAAAWGLESEPWTFIIDSDGTLVERFEGAIVASHIRVPA